MLVETVLPWVASLGDADPIGYRTFQTFGISESGLDEVIAAIAVAPLSASVIQMLTEFFGMQYVDFHREQARSRQEALVLQHISGPLTEWLTQWPTTGGSQYQTLQQILKRFPQSLQQLEAAVESACK